MTLHSFQLSCAGPSSVVRRRLRCFGLLALLLLCARAPAGVCAEERDVTCGSEASVFVRFEGQGWPGALARETLDDLRAGLRVRGIALCSVEDSFTTPPVATVVLRMGSDPVHYDDALRNSEANTGIAVQTDRRAGSHPAQDHSATALTPTGVTPPRWINLRL